MRVTKEAKRSLRDNCASSSFDSLDLTTFRLLPFARHADNLSLAPYAVEERLTQQLNTSCHPVEKSTESHGTIHYRR